MTESTNEIRDARRLPVMWADKRIVMVFGQFIHAHGLAVYMALAAHAGPGGQAFPSVATLARLIGAKEDTTRRALHALKDAGLIAIEARYTVQGGQTSNIYTLLDVPASPAPTPEMGDTPTPETGEGGTPEMGGTKMDSLKKDDDQRDLVAMAFEQVTGRIVNPSDLIALDSYAARFGQAAVLAAIGKAAKAQPGGFGVKYLEPILLQGEKSTKPALSIDPLEGWR
jgi:hypothetical protein